MVRDLDYFVCQLIVLLEAEGFEYSEVFIGVAARSKPVLGLVLVLALFLVLVLDLVLVLALFLVLVLVLVLVLSWSLSWF